MSKLLKDVVDYLKETQGLSMSQISKDLGKGRNYIREAIERDISMDKQVYLITQMHGRVMGFRILLAITEQQATKYHVAQEQVDVVNEENRKLEKHCASLKTTLEHRNKSLSEANRTVTKMGQELKRSLDNSDRLYCESQTQRKHLEQRLCNATAKNKELEQQAVILNKEIDGLNESLAKEKKVSSYLVGVERRAEELEKELFDEKEACDIGSKQIDYQNEIIKGFRTKCKDLEVDANNWQRTSKIWKVSFIMTSIFLLALVLGFAPCVLT